MALELKNLPANTGDIRDSGSIPRSGRSNRPREDGGHLSGDHGNWLQYSGLESPGGVQSIGSQKVGYIQNHTTSPLQGLHEDSEFSYSRPCSLHYSSVLYLLSPDRGVISFPRFSSSNVTSASLMWKMRISRSPLNIKFRILTPARKIFLKN